jgi:hypothetical protein
MILSVSFIVIGMLKLSDLQTFANALTAHSLIPLTWIPVLKTLIPLGELAIGAISLVDLCDRRRQRNGLLFLILALGVLTIYAFTLTITPPPVPAPCGCGFAQQPVDSWLSITLRNLALAFLPLFSLLFVPRPPK